MPGVIVFVGVIGLSVGYDYLVKEILNCKNRNLGYKNMRRKLLGYLRKKDEKEYTCIDKIALLYVLKQVERKYNACGFKMLYSAYWFSRKFHHEFVTEFEIKGIIGTIHFLNNRFEYAINKKGLTVEEFEATIIEKEYGEDCNLESILAFVSKDILNRNS